ncbi:uncharacterized protein K452DRAFT_49606 [Aplosporella prunicola CBS 121167]|uniref:Uncharacterized protein n=1 Tax=Aplosporella prunicola CBS 121167 TaxID=1176127 RepID=A0A6A6BCP7_9PEZI|nr:uncharacterized protein K452DRAFT_49606 [Aplosporella prunicola CBS 121167]KAF2140657.1 hypothetical protein K452DRAFT_49606 [Aplosporella prunicola CBS 121167]
MNLFLLLPLHSWEKVLEKFLTLYLFCRFGRYSKVGERCYFSLFILLYISLNNPAAVILPFFAGQYQALPAGYILRRYIIGNYPMSILTLYFAMPLDWLTLARAAEAHHSSKEAYKEIHENALELEDFGHNGRPIRSNSVTIAINTANPVCASRRDAAIVRPLSVQQAVTSASFSGISHSSIESWRLGKMTYY